MLHLLQLPQPARSVAFSPDGELVAAGYSDSNIHVWRVSDGLLLDTLTGHKGIVSSLSFSPDGQWLVSGSTDNTLRLYQTQDEEGTLKPRYILVGHTGPVNSVAFSPDGTLIASGSDDHNILLWSLPED